MSFEDLKLMSRCVMEDGAFEVYPFDSLTINDLLCKFYKVINDGTITINKYTKLIDSFLDWVKDEGLTDEVKKGLDILIENGTISNILNGELLTDINDKLEDNNNKIVEFKDTINENMKNFKDEIREDISDLNNLTSILKSEIDVTNVTVYGLENCVGDGVFDNAIRLQKIIDYAEKNEIKNIVFPKGRYLINNSILFDANKLNKVYGKGATIITDITDGLYLFKPKDNEIGNMYNNVLVFEDLMFKGYGRDNGSREHGTCFKLSSEGLGASRVRFSNINIQDFKVGFYLGKNSYLNMFDNVAVGHCGTCYQVVEEGNSGENYNIHGGCIYNSFVGLEINNPFTTINIIGTSLDYLDKKIIHLDKGKIFLDSCHIESNREFYVDAPFKVEDYDGNILNIDNSSLIFIEGEGKKLPNAFFENKMSNRFSGINITNCFLQGLKTNNNKIAMGIGSITFRNNDTFAWDKLSSVTSLSDNLIFDGMIYNADLSAHNDIIISDNGNGKKESSYHTWNNEHCIKITKISDNSSEDKKFLDIDFIVDSAKIDKFIGGQFDVFSNKRANIDIAIRGWMISVNGEKKAIDLHREGNIILEPNVKTPLIPAGRMFNVKDKWFTHYSLSISMFNCEQNTELYIKNIFVNGI